MKITKWLFIVLLGTALVSAQEQPHRYSLDEAIAFALENNYSSVNASRDMIDAQKQKWEVIADGLPQINAAISYQNQLKQPVSLIPAEFFGGEPGTFTPITFGQPQQANATATLKQQIFDGSYIVGVQATRTFLDYSKNNKEKTDQEVKAAVVNAYGNVLLAQETVTIAQNNKNTLEKTLFETQKLFENGLGDEESVEQLQITLSSVESGLKNAQRLEGITLQILNLVMGLPISTPTILTEDLDDLTRAQIAFNMMDSELNIKNNVDYKLVLNLNEQRELELKLARSRALPKLNAFVNYGSTSFSDSFNFFSGDPEWFDSSILGFDLDIPIFSSLKRSASTQRAKIALDKAKTQLFETEERVRLDWQRARSDFQFAIEEYQTKKNNLDLAGRIEQKNQIKYQEGLASSFELRQAQTQLYSAQQEYLQSMVDVINRKTALENILNQ
ncbi:MAG: TolC family protein [Bacteroidia bacterium]|nr:TolC family protein [Bacteroidia bacterium]